METPEMVKRLTTQVVDEVEDYCILLLDSKGYINSWNKGAEKMFGYLPAETLGRHIGLCFTSMKPVNGESETPLQRADDEVSAREEMQCMTKSGHLFWSHVTLSPIHENSIVIGYIVIARDLTSQRKLIASLRASEERYSRMIEEVQDYAIILLDTDGIIQNWNLGAEQLKGYKASEIVGHSFRCFYPSRDRQNQLPEALLALARLQGRAHHEGWRVRKNGTEFWGSIVITALHNDQGEVIGFSKVTKDLTAKKQAEEAQTRYLEQLESRNREMEQLTYIASHDLQQPLRTITSFLTMFENKYKDLVDDSGHNYVDRIMKAAGRMRELIKAMLEYSTLGSNRTISQVDMEELLEDVKQDLYESIVSSGANIKHNSLPVIAGYRLELRQLLQNLLSNGIKFHRQGVPPCITLTVSKEEDRWVFCLQDNGIGIEETYKQRIFIMFQRLHAGDLYPGNGIGLAYAQKIMTLHNGHLWVESVPGEGSSFFFSVPFLL